MSLRPHSVRDVYREIIENDQFSANKGKISNLHLIRIKF